MANPTNVSVLTSAPPYAGVVNDYVYVQGTVGMDGNAYDSFIPAKKTGAVVTKIAGNTGTPQVYTVTITRANSTDYGMYIVQDQSFLTTNAPDNATIDIRFTSTATASSGSSIVDSFVAAINACDNFKGTAAKTADTTFTITAATNFEVFNCGATTANISIADTTTGVLSRGTPYRMLYYGYVTTSLLDELVITTLQPLQPELSVYRQQEVTQLLFGLPANITTIQALFS